MGSAAGGTGKLNFIDGLKGTGALIVYLCHFAYAFYYSLYSLDEASAHTETGVEILIGKSPLNILYNGNFAVHLFFVASGFVLCIRFFRDYDRKRLAKSAVKRYFRLAVPILLVSTVIFFLMIAGLYKNTEAAVLAGSEEWFAGFNNFEPGYSHALREAVIGCFLFGHNYFNGVLWTVKYLFLGALLVYAVAALAGKWKYRYVLYAVLMAGLFLTDYAGIFAGFWLCDLYYTKPRLMKWVRRVPWLCAGIFVLGVYFGSYPSVGTRLEGSIYAWLPEGLSVTYHFIGAAMIVAGAAGSSVLSRFFSCRILTGLGRISFSWYLLHFPVIATFSSALLLALYGKLSYHLLMGLNFVLTTLIVWGLSFLMTKYVEEPYNRFLSRW